MRDEIETVVGIFHHSVSWLRRGIRGAAEAGA